MGKKILTLILAVTVILSAFSFNIQAAETNEQKQAVLQSLGIIGEDFSKKVCYDTYIQAVMNLVFTGEAVSPESFARSVGFIESNEKYVAADSITVGEAIKLAVIAAGYKVSATDGTMEAYVSTAYEIGLFKGVSASATEKLSAENAINILYNLLEVEPLIWSYPDNYKVQDKEDMLGMYKGIYLHKGIVTANEFTAVNGVKGVRENEIAINGEVFETTVDYDPEILGKPVEAYIQERKGEDPLVVYIGVSEGKYNSLTIDGEDIEAVAPDFSEIEYSEAGNDRIRTAEFEQPLKVIYNGKFYGEYTAADLKPEIGEITLIDSNGEAGYEIVSVTSYETMVVEAINTSEKIITSKYDFTDALDYVSLDGSDVIYNIYKDDAEIALSAIKAGDVLSVARTKSTGDVMYKIYVCSDSEESAVVSLVDEENEIETEEDIYEYTAEFARHLADKGQSVELGKRYTFLFDIFGNIVYSIRTMDNDYALLFKIGTKGGMDNDVEVKYLTIDGDWKISKVAEKVNYGIGTESDKISAATLHTYLGQESPQVVKLKQNANGEISSLITAKETGSYMDGTFTKTPSTDLNYRNQATTFGCQFYINGATKMFVFPPSPTGNDEDYYVVNALDVVSSDKSYPVCAYDMDNFGFADIISITETEAVSGYRYNANLFVITAIGQGLSADGEICTRFTGTIGGLRNISFLAEPDYTVEGGATVAVGDIVNIRVSRSGMINSIRPKDTTSGAFTKYSLGNYHDVGNNNVCRGTIADIDAANGRIKLDCGSSVSFRISNSIPCTTYNKTKNKCELSTVYELMKGDKLFVRVLHSNIQEIIRVVD